MVRYTITLKGPDGATERLVYDPHASRLTREDGRPVDLSPVGFAYRRKPDWQAVQAVSPENPGRKVRAARKLKVMRGFRCNYACAYCGQASQAGREEPTGLEDARRFLANLGSWWDGGEDGEGGGTNVQFWGGEPFVYWKKLKLLAEGIRGRWPHAALSVITNGSLLDGDKIDWLDRMGFAVAVSHDGPGQRLRGPDPFEDSQKAVAIRRLFTRLHPKGRFSFNVVLTRDHYSLEAAREWLIERVGSADVVVGTEELLLPYDAGGLMLSPATEAEHKRIRLALLGEIMDGSALAVSSVWMKIRDFLGSLAEGRPAAALGQKCGMDRAENIAVDLKGNVYTCQNTGEAAHRIGHVDALDDVRLTTATHWSLQDECRRCPVVQLCKGACMYLDGEYWQRACDNSFTWNLAMLAGALWMLTGKVAVHIDGPMRREAPASADVLPEPPVDHGRVPETAAET